VVHHLFPSICHTHYPAIAPIVLQTCKEFSVPYMVYPTVRRSSIGCAVLHTCDWQMMHTSMKRIHVRTCS
jgi:fatty acid desaturase